jgi:hypothetical protein
VECGVWRGGNGVLASGIFELNDSAKKVYLYDTFSGMTKPSEYDMKLGSNNNKYVMNYFD